ncbi:MAG: YedE family putative selenium transporter [Desulfobacteraceae bacterium]|nr:YedE family putative selenium transporter [Desulfobacteraceae bacterium]
MNLRDRNLWVVILSGLALGTLGVLLAVWGNPANSGICVSCFIENSAGALGMHNNARMQYLRPELIGFLLGAVASAVIGREFKSRGGSAPLLRLVSGIFLIIGCSVFIGCPIKLLLRLTAGDLTAVAGVAGLVGGVWIGVKMAVNGVELGPQQSEGTGGGLVMPFVFLLLLAFFIARPEFIIFSAKGSGAEAAPWLIALGSGLLLGALAQRSQFCITGSIRDLFLVGVRTYLIWGLGAFLLSAFVLSLATGRLHVGLYGQPGAHLDHLWSFLGMLLVGWVSVLIGGCPFRQLVKAGEGNTDAGLVVVGMFIGGAVSQSWGIAATAAGVPFYGKVAVLLGLALLSAVSLFIRQRIK